MSVNFYEQLTPFNDFEDFTSASHYQAVPQDWFVYITDVVNSTAAIEKGLYKEVNLVGAASITLCIRLLKGMAFPFVFGGDGASLCIPAEKSLLVDAELGSLVQLAELNFGIQLRVAKIPVSTLIEQDKALQVAKYQLKAGNTLAFFRGGALEWADHLAKTQYDTYKIPVTEKPVEELAGLSCRWSPIPASKACIVSLLIKSRQSDVADTYAAVISAFREIMGESLDAANPAVLDKVRYKSFLSALREERRYHKRVLSLGFLKRIFEIIMAIIIFRYNVNVASKSFDSSHYLDNLRYHSDYRKFDDMLRLVLDCSEEQAEGLSAYLEQERQNGAVYYGLFRSREALMTCFVETMQDGGHLHFIDGGSGGLAMAAQQLKGQMAFSSETSAQ